jgi:hypothetical protein
VFATEQLSKDFGPLLASYARQIELEKADQTICLFDGAVWIYQQVCQALLYVQMILLDFYHLAEHVHAAARCCLGQTAEARSWAHQRLAEAKGSKIAEMLDAVAATGKKARSPVKKQGLSHLENYVRDRRDMLDYGKALAEEWDIGSGPTEATCKTLTLRLKRPGMKWDRDNAAAMMNLVALRESGQWDAYWDREARKAAA